jgi:hypothetical protein
MENTIAVINGICKIPTKSEIQTVLKNVGSNGWRILREGGDSPEEILENVIDICQSSHEIISEGLEKFLRKSGFETQIAGNTSWEFVKVTEQNDGVILILNLFEQNMLIDCAVGLSMHWLREGNHIAEALYGTTLGEILTALDWEITDCFDFNAEPQIMFDDFTIEIRKREEDIVSEML